MVQLIIENEGTEINSELLLLDFQGAFESELPLEGQSLGQLTLQDDKATLVVGRQKISGKRQKLSNPVCIIRKVLGSSNTETCRYVFENKIIKTKIVFSSRPIHSVSKEHQGKIIHK
jgi:hypothetical protein